MICNFCGAEYPDNAQKCYHCHSENPKMAKKLKKEVLHAFDKEAEAIKKDLPKKAVKKAHKLLLIILAGIILLLFTFAIVWIGMAKGKQKLEYEIMQHNIARMEEMFQDGDVEGLMEYYDNLTDRSYVYDKYRQIYRVGYFNRPWVYERYEDYLKYTKEYHEDEDKDDYLKMREDHLYWVLESGREALRDMYLYVNDRVILGNEQFLLEWKVEMEQFFLNEVGLSEEELYLLRTVDAGEDADDVISQLVQKIMKGDETK